MKTCKSAIGFAAALAASGCISVRDLLPKPPEFQTRVASRQLDAVAVAAPTAGPAPAAEVTLAPVVVAEVAPQPAPERTEVEGEGDGSMEVDSVTVTVKGIEHRAPNYSSEQAASMVCAAQKMGFNLDNAKKMHEATLAAERAWAGLETGAVKRKDWEAAERRRQDSVINYMVPVPVFNWFVNPSQKKKDFPEPKSGALVIEHPDLFTFKENGRKVIAVSGYVRNAGTERVEMPPVTLRALDQWEFAIAGQTSLLPFESLGPGEEKRFEVRFLNPPAYTHEVYVHFAPPFVYRSARDCDFFDPSRFDETASLKTAVAETRDPGFFDVPVVLPTTDKGPYTAAELNELTLFFRGESEATWRCANRQRDACGSAAQRLHWRDMFVLSEATDEAWVAFRAAEETRGRLGKGEASEADAAKADAARDAAITKFTTLAHKALARSGGSAADIAVALTASNYGRDEDGLYFDIAGVVRNTGTETRKVDNLMVAFVDRHDMPLSSLALEAGITLAPGESQTFSKRLEAGRGGRGRSAAPARIPPQSIPWEVRVGAMARP